MIMQTRSVPLSWLWKVASGQVPQATPQLIEYAKNNIDWDKVNQDRPQHISPQQFGMTGNEGWFMQAVGTDPEPLWRGVPDPWDKIGIEDPHPDPPPPEDPFADPDTPRPVDDEKLNDRLYDIVYGEDEERGRNKGEREKEEEDMTGLEKGHRIHVADPVMNFVLQEYQDGYQNAKDINEARYKDIMGGFDTMGDEILGNMLPELRNKHASREGDFRHNMEGTLGEFEGQYDQAKADRDALNAQYEQRTSDIMGRFEGLGDVQREDLDNSWMQERSRQDQGLASRGLGNTTVQNSISKGVTEGRNLDRRRLDEGLRRDEIGHMTQLTGEALGARGQGLRDVEGLGKDLFGRKAAYANDMADLQYQNLGFEREYIDRYENLMGQRLNFMNSRQDEYPGLDQITNLAIQAGRESASRQNVPLAPPVFMSPQAFGYSPYASRYPQLGMGNQQNPGVIAPIV